LVTAAKVVAIIAIPGYAKDYEREWETVIKSFLLIPQEHLPLIGAAWTLSHELLFYALFALFILVGIRGSVLMLVAWAVAIVATNLTADARLFDGDNYIVRFVLNERNLEFIVGCLSAWLCLRGPIWRPGLWLLGGAGMLVIGGLYVDRVGAMPLLMHTMLFGTGSFLIVTSTCYLERTGRLRMPRALVFLGDASYSIYLLAFAFVNIVGLVAIRMSVLEPGAQLGGLMIVAAVCGGAASYVVLERPILRMARARPLRRSLGAPGQPAAALPVRR